MSGIQQYRLASPTWDEAEIEAVLRCAKAQTLSMGEAVFEFERRFAAFVGAKYATMVNSGSSANLLMTAALFYTKPRPMLTAGDEVIVPAISWPTTYYPLAQYGLRLKFVDIDIDTLNYNLEDLSSAITNNTRAVIAVNLLGNPNDFSRINEILKNRNIILLEDNCESLGAVFQGRQAGVFGLMGTCSFFFSHHICTMEGGMIVTNDPHLHDILVCLRAHGWTRNLEGRNSLCIKSDDKFKESFRFLLPGYNLRPLEMSGAIGIEQLKKLPEFLKQRKKNAHLFQKLFKENKNFIIQQEIGESSWFGFSLIVAPNAPFTRNEAVAALMQNGIECRPIVAGNFAAKETMGHLAHSVHGSLTNAEYVDENGFFIGNDHLNHESDLYKVYDLLASLGNE